MPIEPDIKNTAGIPPIYFILNHLAPVIFGGKPACLLNYSEWRIEDTILDPNHRQENIIQSFSGLFPLLSGLDCLQFQDRNLIMFFHPQRLPEFLTRHENFTFLKTLGYQSRFDLAAYFELLRKRFTNSIPHEIGIFLGIPAADVRSFIQNRGKNYLFNQYWKVYHNPGQARSTFNAYDLAKVKMTRICQTTFI